MVDIFLEEVMASNLYYEIVVFAYVHNSSSIVRNCVNGLEKVTLKHLFIELKVEHAKSLSIWWL